MLDINMQTNDCYNMQMWCSRSGVEQAIETLLAPKAPQIERCSGPMPTAQIVPWLHQNL